MKTYCLLLLALLLSAGLPAQQLTTFQRGYNDTITYSLPFNSGNYIYSDVAEMSDRDFLAALRFGLLRTDNLGKPKWMMSYAVPGFTPL